MNTIQVMGRATADPDVRMTQSGNMMTRFTIAVDKKLTKQQREEYVRESKSTADFFRVVSWGAVAEILERYLKKGARIVAAGTLTTNSYEKEGERLFFTEIHAERIQIIDLPERKVLDSNEVKSIEGVEELFNDECHHSEITPEVIPDPSDEKQKMKTSK